MNEEVKQQWVVALRSGKYPQGRSYLNVNGNFCCLGVLCELAVDVGVVVRKLETEGCLEIIRYESVDFPPDASCGVLPSAVAQWAGIQGMAATNPTIGQKSASYLNDLPTPFSKIADLIEEYL